MNEILFAEIYYICVAIMLILGFKTYHSMMKNSQKVSFLAVVLVHILYFQTDLVRMTTNGQDLFLNEMSFLFFSLCTLSWFNYIQTMLEVHYVKKIANVIRNDSCVRKRCPSTCKYIEWMFISNRFIWKFSRRTTLYFVCIYKRSLFYGWSLSSLCV